MYSFVVTADKDYEENNEFSGEHRCNSYFQARKICSETAVCITGREKEIIQNELVYEYK